MHFIFQKGKFSRWKCSTPLILLSTIDKYQPRALLPHPNYRVVNHPRNVVRDDDDDDGDDDDVEGMSRGGIGRALP